MDAQVVKRDTDGVITLTKFWDQVDEDFEQGATVTFALFDSAGTSIPDGTGSMTQESGTSGAATRYIGDIPYTLTLPSGRGKAKVTAIATSGKRRRFVIPIQFED